MLPELKSVWRSLAKSRGYFAITVLTLALGIGANTAVFSVVQGVLLKPLPYSHPERLYRVFMRHPSFKKFALNPNDFLDFRARTRAFESLGAFVEDNVQISDPDRPERLSALAVSKDYFHVLGFQPALGSGFDASHERRESAHAVMLSDALWRRRFNADPNVVGRKLMLDEEPYTIVGVMPASFLHVGGDYRSPGHGETVDAWVPFPFPTDRKFRGAHFLNVAGRLKDGFTADQAAADLNRIADDLAKEFPNNRGWGVQLGSLYQEIAGKPERMLLVLLGAVGLVLLIACVNAANLLLARSTARQREMAVRSALGASRRRIVGHVMVESCSVAAMAGALGTLIAIWGVRVLVALAPRDFPRTFNIDVNGVVLAFTFAIAMLTGIVFGLAPAFQSARADLNEALREGGRGSTTGARHFNLRNALVVVEVCLASALMIGAGLLLRTFVNVMRTEPGFRAEHVLTARVNLPRARYTEGKAVARFFKELLDRAGVLPGVKGAGASTDLPWSGYDENASFTIEGRPRGDFGTFPVRYHAATAGFFNSIGMPLLSGRTFTASDTAESRAVIVINQTCARRYWRGEDPVGKRVSLDDKPAEKDWLTIVGVVGDVKDTPASDGAKPAFWWAHSQVPFNEMALIVRTAGEPMTATSALRRELAAMDRDLSLSAVKTLDDVVGGALSQSRFVLFVMGLFSAVALILAAIGMYGVMSYAVAQRAHEFGVRIALGATKRHLIVMVTAQGMKLVLAGTICGLALALMLSRVLSSLVYGVSVRDAATYLAAASVAVLAGIAACYGPSRRATNADPMTALRSE